MTTTSRVGFREETDERANYEEPNWRIIRALGFEVEPGQAFVDAEARCLSGRCWSILRP